MALSATETTEVTVTKDEWVQISGAGNSSIAHLIGGQVSLTQADTKPLTLLRNTPEMAILNSGDNKVLFSVPVAVYAIARDEDAVISHTPAA